MSVCFFHHDIPLGYALNSKSIFHSSATLICSFRDLIIYSPWTAAKKCSYIPSYLVPYIYQYSFHLFVLFYFPAPTYRIHNNYYHITINKLQSKFINIRNVTGLSGFPTAVANKSSVNYS